MYSSILKYHISQIEVQVPYALLDSIVPSHTEISAGYICCCIAQKKCDKYLLNRLGCPSGLEESEIPIASKRSGFSSSILCVP